MGFGEQGNWEFISEEQGSKTISLEGKTDFQFLGNRERSQLISENKGTGTPLGGPR